MISHLSYVLVKPHLERTGLPPIKPIGRFEAAEPNALWQDDIQGKLRFPLLGGLFLVLVKDDHSRLLLVGRWFFHHTRSTCFENTFRFIQQRVWTLLMGDRLTIECNREVIATYPVKTDHLDVVSRDN